MFPVIFNWCVVSPVPFWNATHLKHSILSNLMVNCLITNAKSIIGKYSKEINFIINNFVIVQVKIFSTYEKYCNYLEQVPLLSKIRKLKYPPTRDGTSWIFEGHISLRRRKSVVSVETLLRFLSEIWPFKIQDFLSLPPTKTSSANIP